MKTTTTIFLFLGVWAFAMAQDGPGDVKPADVNGENRLVLWLDASTLDITDGNNVTTWPDLSGYTGTDLTQTNVNAKPNLIKSTLNGRAVVRFDGDDEELTGSHKLQQAPATIFSVFKFDNAIQGNDNDYVYSLGTANSTNEQLSLTRRRNTDAGNENEFYSWDGTTARFGDVLTDQAYISRQVFDTAMPFHSAFFNGTTANAADYDAALANMSQEISLGDWATTVAFNNDLDGYIAEFIIYDTLLGQVETSIVENYLSAKYAITIAGDLYAGNLDTDVTGIGTESDGSKSEASSAGIEVSQVSGFENADYLLIGHETSENTVNTADIGVVSGSLLARWDRYWYFDVTDASTTATIDITFDHSDGDFFNTIEGGAADYSLLYRSTESGDWTKLVDANSIEEDRVIFTNVTITNDGYYTLGTSFTDPQPFGLEKVMFDLGTGPAGVGRADGSGNLKLWFDASAMNAVDDDLMVTWEDFSGYGHNATQNTFSKIPTFDEAVTDINNRDAILFNESPVNTAGEFYNGTLDNPINSSTTLVAVGYFGSVNQDDDDNDYFIGIGSGTSANEVLSISRRRADEQPIPGGVDHPDEYYSWYGTEAPRYGPTITGQEWNIYYQTIDASTNSHDLALDGMPQAASNYTATLSTNTDFSIGKWATDENNFLDGEVAEIILFDKKLNSAEDTILHNYLSAKYNLPIPTDKDIYAGDEGINGDYDDDVAGIGTEADGSNDNAVSAGMQISIGSPFANGEYLIVGHNEPTNIANGSDVNLPGAIKERSNRDWYFDITASGNVTIDILFDLSDLDVALPASDASNYALIYRVDLTSEWSTIAIGSSYSNDQIFFDGVALSDDGYYTIGTLNSNDSPLPVEMLTFEAYQQDESIMIMWSTATEVDNDLFKILHSTDAKDFSQIGLVYGNGTTIERNDYQLTHNNPEVGINYYKLSQVDFDGRYDESEIVATLFEEKRDNTSVELFPIPANNSLNLRSMAINDSRNTHMVLYDLQGRIQIKGVLLGNTIDTSSLSNGVYILKLDIPNSGDVKSYKIIVNHKTSSN